MASETSTVDKAGKESAAGADIGAGAALRAKYSSLGDEPAKRGRGRPPGTKNGVGKGSSVISSSPSSAPGIPSETFNRQMGLAHRGLGNILAYSSNCTVWLLDDKQEKDLGDTLGNTLAAMGLANSMAVSLTALVLCEAGVWGSKFIGYLAYRNEMQALEQAKLKNPEPISPASTQSGVKESPKGDDPWTSKPGLI